MLKWLVGGLLLSSICSHATDVQFDRKDRLQGVILESGKNDDVRAYRARFTQIIAAPILEVRAGIVNFTEKCNNQLSKRRQWLNHDTHCAFPNESVIETRVERNLKPHPRLQGETDHYILSRRGYNRGSYQYQELVRELSLQNGDMIEIRQEMLSEHEAAQWLASAPLPFDHTYDHLTTTYVLKKLSDSRTELSYEQRAETTHWLLNKEIIAPQVLAGLSRGAKEVWKSVEGHQQRSRQLASQKY
jgi:hypothetical protein